MLTRKKGIFVSGLAAIVLGTSALSTYYIKNRPQSKHLPYQSHEAIGYAAKYFEYYFNLIDRWSERDIAFLLENRKIDFLVEVKAGNEPVKNNETIIVGYEKDSIDKTLVPVTYLKLYSDESGKYKASFIPEENLFYIAWIRNPIKNKMPKKIKREMRKKGLRLDYFPLPLIDQFGISRRWLVVSDKIKFD